MARVEVHEPGTPCWVDLMTPDPEKARAFYGGLFGWKFSVGGPESGHYTMCQMDGLPVAGLGPQPPGATYPPVWTTYFATADADQTAAKVQKLGGKVGMKPMDVMQEGRMAICMDPTGAAFGLWQPRRHKGAAIVDEPGAMTWHEVTTRQATLARDFYSALFGLEPRKMEGMEYYSLHRGPKPYAGVMQMTEKLPPDLPPHWMSYFGTRDADATVARVSKLGGKVHAQPFDTPYGRMAVVADPMGAAFTIIKHTPQT
jgi:uncharacterized protein